MIIKKANFTYSALSKAIEKQIEYQGIKQVGDLKALKSVKNKHDIKSIDEIFPKKMKTNEIRNQIDKIKKSEEKIKRKDLKYEIKRYAYHFQQFETMRFFGENIYTLKARIFEAEKDQSNLPKTIVEFNNKFRSRKKVGKD